MFLKNTTISFAVMASLLSLHTACDLGALDPDAIDPADLTPEEAQDMANDPNLFQLGVNVPAEPVGLPCSVPELSVRHWIDTPTTNTATRHCQQFCPAGQTYMRMYISQRGNVSGSKFRFSGRIGPIQYPWEHNMVCFNRGRSRESNSTTIYLWNDDYSLIDSDRAVPATWMLQD